MNSHWSLLLVRVTAVLGSLLALYQGLSGMSWLGNPHQVHPHTGEAIALLMLLAAIGAFVWSRRSGNTGLFMHAAGMVVLAGVQLALGYAGVREAHMAVGLLFLVGVLALASLSLRKPGTDGGALDARRDATLGR